MHIVREAKSIPLVLATVLRAQDLAVVWAVVIGKKRERHDIR